MDSAGESKWLGFFAFFFSIFCLFCRHYHKSKLFLKSKSRSLSRIEHSLFHFIARSVWAGNKFPRGISFFQFCQTKLVVVYLLCDAVLLNIAFLLIIWFTYAQGSIGFLHLSCELWCKIESLSIFVHFICFIIHSNVSRYVSISSCSLSQISCNVPGSKGDMVCFYNLPMRASSRMGKL